MSNYHTASSDEGLVLPYFGRIAGDLAKDFRVPVENLSDESDTDPKTIQRFFRGDSIHADRVDTILRAMAKLAIPERLRAAVSDELVRRGRWWNEVATTVNVNTYPVTKVADLAWAPLRLTALELGLRLGALDAALGLRGRDPLGLAMWLDPDVGAWLKMRMNERGITVDGLAQRLEVNRNTVDDWRQGRSLPTKHQAIIALAEALQEDDQDHEDAVFALRLRVGFAALRKRLVSLVGQERFDDLLAGLELTARRTLEWVEQMRDTYEAEPPAGMRVLEDLFEWKRLNDLHRTALPNDAWSVATKGLGDSLSLALCSYLAELAVFRPQARAAFGALAAGDWASSIQLVYRDLGTLENLDRLDSVETILPLGPQVDAEAFREMMKVVPSIWTEAQLKLRDFDWKPPDGAHVVELTFPPQVQAMDSSAHAARLEASGDLLSAIVFQKKAVALSPETAVLRFQLGAYLGQLAARTQFIKVQGKPLPDALREVLVILPGGVESIAETALTELREAVRLDPQFGNARNEIGIVLSNVGRHAEAELAFAEAEPFHHEHAHHWYCRGGNLLALERFDEAVKAFKKAKSLNRGNDHLDARMMLSATWMALGRSDWAKAEGRPVESRRGFHPADHWQWLLALPHTSRANPFHPPVVQKPRV